MTKVEKPVKLSQSTPPGDSDKPRSFPDGSIPRMYSNSRKRIIK